MTWEPKYGDWDPEEVQVPKLVQSRGPISNPDPGPDWAKEAEKMRKIQRTPSPALPKPATPTINWVNWIQRLTIAVLICVVAWMIYRSEFAKVDTDRPAAIQQLDWPAMDKAANAARAKVYAQAAQRAGEFQDLQSLIKWQDEALRTARLEAYQPWVDELSKHLDEDRYDPKVAADLFQRAADEANY